MCIGNVLLLVLEVPSYETELNGLHCYRRDNVISFLFFQENKRFWLTLDFSS